MKSVQKRWTYQVSAIFSTIICTIKLIKIFIVVVSLRTVIANPTARAEGELELMMDSSERDLSAHFEMQRIVPQGGNDNLDSNSDDARIHKRHHHHHIRHHHLNSSSELPIRIPTASEHGEYCVNW